MTDTPSTGATDQTPPVIIERIDTPMPSFFSEKIGRDFGSPAGGWTGERAKATRMDDERAKELLAAALQHAAPHCKVVPA